MPNYCSECGKPLYKNVVGHENTGINLVKQPGQGSEDQRTCCDDCLPVLKSIGYELYGFAKGLPSFSKSDK